MGPYTFSSLFFITVFTVSCHKSHPPAAVAVPITAMRVEPQTIPADFEFIGVGESSHIVQIRARVEGYLESLDYKEGRLVQRDLDRALADQLAAAAEVETAKADLYKAAINLGFTSIQAPVTGLSGQAKYREGALISPGAGDENLLTTLYVVDPIWVNFNISDNELLQLKQDVAEKQVQLPKDMHFQIEAILSDGTVVPTEGVIDFNNPAIQQSTGTMLFRSVFPNPKISIYPGQVVNVIVKGAVRPGAIAVPQTALVQGGKGTFVYVVENGKALERMVVPGDWYKDFWIINSGLKAGDIVVAIGVNKLQHESPVAIQSMLSSTLP